MCTCHCTLYRAMACRFKFCIIRVAFLIIAMVNELILAFDWKMHQQHFNSEINESFPRTIHMFTTKANSLCEVLNFHATNKSLSFKHLVIFQANLTY